jgi:capsular exopolysaccharide synthesis family protein
VSRIHDALKKAEEERLASLGSSPELPPEVPFVGKFSVGVGEMPLGEEPEVHKGVLNNSEANASPHPVDRLHNRSQTIWSPTKDAIFLSGQDNNSLGMEEFRTLRAKLFQLRTKKPLKTILVSSALPGEGKSFVSANLAQAFARQRGSKTLLIDADLRKPHMHELLGAPASPGISDYMVGKVGEFEIIQKSASNEDLFFIPGGKVSATASEMIGTGRFRYLLEALAPLFSWVVIDSSPVIPVSDPTRIAELCDGVLLVIQAGSTSHLVAERAKREFHDTPLLGVVFNQVKVKETPYYKYSYSSYGH